MKLNSVLIKKCVELNADISLEDKIALYSSHKLELINSNNYWDYFVKLCYAFITAYSLFDKVVDIHYYSYNEIIGQEFVENLNHFLKELQEKNPSWDLDDETIQRRIEWILINKYNRDGI